MRRALAVALACTALGGCFGPDPGLTQSGEAKPIIDLDFPESAEAGDVETAAVMITNPGPGAMDSVVVAFSRLGDPELPPPIVDVVSRGRPGPVVSVDPQPNAVSGDGVLYTFDGLAEQESATISFELSIPEVTEVGGSAGNAVLVYDGSDPERARGVRLEVVVER